MNETKDIGHRKPQYHEGPIQCMQFHQLKCQQFVASCAWYALPEQTRSMYKTALFMIYIFQQIVR